MSRCGLDTFLSSFSTSRCSRNRSPTRLSVSTMSKFSQKVQVIDGIGRGTSDEMISDFDGSLGSRYFLYVAK